MNLNELFKQKRIELQNIFSKGGIIKGHEWVDMGLSVKWASCNVGASSPNEVGWYFAWGETEPKQDYTWENYKFRLEGRYYNAVFSKYLPETVRKKGDNIHYSEFSYASVGADIDTKSGKHGIVDGRERLDLCDDAARCQWGGKWRMPTREECDELVNNCSWKETTVGGKNGYRAASKVNGNSIFIPDSGCWDKDGISDGLGFLWSSNIFTDELFQAIAFEFAYSPTFESDMIGWTSRARCYGLPIRPVFY